LAHRVGGTIINADAMQCYADLRIVTARPTPADESAAPHRLYGFQPAATPITAATWRAAAIAALESAEIPIITGGTGLYLSALMNGIAPIPEPDPDSRATARAAVAEHGPAAIHARLDPATAARTDPANPQRVARAYEVILATGRGLAAWQSEPTDGLKGYTASLILLDPARDSLREAIASRFTAMLEAGVLDEVRSFLAQNLDPALPLMRAHGVPELAAYLRGEISLALAAERAILATHQYTKRQMTWFRHQKLVAGARQEILHNRITDSAQFSESFMADLLNFIYGQA
jgi:tRNA dimethylallyltransferase